MCSVYLDLGIKSFCRFQEALHNQVSKCCLFFHCAALPLVVQELDESTDSQRPDKGKNDNEADLWKSRVKLSANRNSVSCIACNIQRERNIMC